MELLRRKIDRDLAAWKKNSDRLPLIVKGADRSERRNPYGNLQKKTINLLGFKDSCNYSFG